MGYGFDDRAGAYVALRALLEIDRPQITTLAVFYDREEVGFKGNTGSDSPFLRRYPGTTGLPDNPALTKSGPDLANILGVGKVVLRLALPAKILRKQNQL